MFVSLKLNYNFECDWLIKLSDYKLFNNNLASELVENRSFLTNHNRGNCNFMITMRKSIHWSPFLSYMGMVLRLAALLAAELRYNRSTGSLPVSV